MTSAQQFLDGFAAATDCSAWSDDVAGTFVCADADRAGTGRVSACRVVGSGPSRTILRADPALAEALSPLASTDGPLDDDAFLEWAEHHSAVTLGRSLMKTLGQPPAAPQRTPHVLNWAESGDMDLIRGFVERVDEDDLDEAEIDLDALDEKAVCLVNPSGQMEAYASTQPFDEAPTFGDIGIAVAPDVRQQGVGSEVLRGLINHVLLPEGILPLYRCDPDNAASDRLSAALGFETVLELLVVEVPNVGSETR